MPDKSRPSKRVSARAASGDVVTAGNGTPAEVAEGPAGSRRSAGPQVRPKNGLDRYFEISARRSTMTRELRGGLTTFFTMAYIVVLNPIILSGADVNGTTLPFASVAAVTALVAGVMTILMGIVGKYPFALAA